MKRKIIPIALFMGIIMLLSSCASPASVHASGEVALLSARQAYLDSSLVVTGACTGSHNDSDGNLCYDLCVEDVIAGEAEYGATIHCTSGKMTVGQSYLLYLGKGDDVYHTEDMVGYKLLSGTPLPIQNDVVDFSGASIPLDALKLDIREASDTVQAPASVFYYKYLNALVEAADEIFIGTPMSVPKLEDVTFHSKENGTSIENKIPADFVTIKAFGSIKGSMVYGDEATLVYSPQMAGDMVDAATLASSTLSSTDAPRLQKGETYIFFLVHGPDAKQDYYFPINAIQGYARLDGETISAASANEPLGSYGLLTAFVKDIRKML